MAQIEQTYLQRLKSMQAEYADANLKTPPGKKSFDFGKVCGVYQGLLLAEQLFNGVIGENDDGT